MPGDTFATRSLDELARQLRQRDAKPELASRGAPRNPNTASVSNTLAEISGVPSDARSDKLGISPPTSAPSRRIAAARPAVGILLYLVFTGLVATVIIAVCFGVGFFRARGSAGLGRNGDARVGCGGRSPGLPSRRAPANGQDGASAGQ